MKKTVRSWGFNLYTRGFLAILLTTLPLLVSAQAVRGTVLNAATLQPVPDVLISTNDTSINMENNPDGTFTIESLPAGRHTLTFQHLQYLPYATEIQVSSSKDLVLDIRMEVRAYPLEEITVQGEVANLPNQLYQITEEEVRRYPGTFFDPARFARSFPGVQIVNDQANQMVINGMSPDLMQWHIEGLEIVNPNHLANAGTVLDNPSATGGGVNMLSNQVLANSSLIQGAGQGLNNATSGVMDMHFRNGNPDQREHTVQLGLLGIEGATEGPFKEGGKSSYLLNLRYSTIGLLGLAGVDFGDEEIQFGDVSLQTRFHLGENAGTLNVFAVVGRNRNKFEAKEPEEVEEEKDQTTIDYSSGAEVIGAVWRKPLEGGNLLSIGSAFSARDYNRDESSELVAEPYEQNEEGNQQKWSLRAAFTKSLPKGHSLEIGANLTTESNKYDISPGDPGISAGYDISNVMFRPYTAFRTVLTNNLRAKFGVALAYYQNSNSWNIEPEAELTWDLSEQNVIIGRYRTSSQALNTLYLTPSDNVDNSTLDPLRAHHASLTWQRAGRGGVIEVSGSYTYLFNVPVTGLATDFSALNLMTHPLLGFLRLTDRGEGETLGFNAGYRRNFSKSFYVAANAGFIASDYTAGDLEERPTTFDAGYSFYLGGGNEWTKKKGYGLRTWGATAGFVQNGGMRYGEINEELSEASGETVYRQGTAGQNQLGDYSRLDIRIYWRKDKTNKSSTWSLDIQNLTNNENDWFPVWDDYLGQVAEQTQLGLIPVLNWRLDF